MQGFEFLAPTKLIFGAGAEGKTGAETAKYAKKVLVVCSRGRTNSTGIVDRTEASLKDAGVEWIELTGVKPNPVLDKVYEGIEIVRKNNIGFILAIGGGSVIDTAKAIGMGAPYEGDVWDIFNGKNIEKTLPVGAVLTIPAAGSEQSNSCVITKAETGQKMGVNLEIIRPVFAVADPAVTLTLDHWQTFCGIADMMMHVLERYISRTLDTDFTDRICEAILRSQIKNGLILTEDPQNLAARAEIMLASTYSHNNFAGIGREQEWVVHGIGKALSGFYDSTHGATISALTASWMRYIRKEAQDRLAQMATRVFDVEYDAQSPERTALEGIWRLEQLYKRFGLPVTLRELGVPLEEAELKRVAEEYERSGARGVFRKISGADALEILQLAKG